MKKLLSRWILLITIINISVFAVEPTYSNAKILKFEIIGFSLSDSYQDAKRKAYSICTDKVSEFNYHKKLKSKKLYRTDLACDIINNNNNHYCQLSFDHNKNLYSIKRTLRLPAKPNVNKLLNKVLKKYGKYTKTLRYVHEGPWLDYELYWSEFAPMRIVPGLFDTGPIELRSQYKGAELYVRFSLDSGSNIYRIETILTNHTIENESSLWIKNENNKYKANMTSNVEF